MERLLPLRFFGETKIQPLESLVKISEDWKLFSRNIQDESVEFNRRFESFKQTIRGGKLGTTPQFRLLYLDMMRNQHMIHLAAQENNLRKNLRLAAWSSLYFVTNQFNYARYGSYYIEVLANIETLYPGLKQLLQKTGLSVQVQEMYPSRVAFHQRGEQTVNRDAKTAGKVSWNLIIFCDIIYIYLLPLYIYCDKRYTRGFLQRHSVACDWRNGCLLYVALIYNTSRSLFLIVAFLLLFCISYKLIHIKNKKLKRLRAIFIYQKHFCNLVVDSLVATSLTKLFFQGIFFSWNSSGLLHQVRLP